MKKTIIIILALLLSGGIVWGTLYHERHKDDRFKAVCGQWESLRGERLTIEQVSGVYRITLLRPYARRCLARESYLLFDRGCLGYEDDTGNRVDVFYIRKTDQLLLFPGGKSYSRLTK